MASLAAKFKQLKTSIGGNREKTHFEYSFGQPMEEAAHITMPSPFQRRILGQIEYALTLSRSSNGVYDDLLHSTLDTLLACIETDGTITKERAMQAEQALLPMAQVAKEYHLILCAHAHIDMNWMWSWQETVAATLDTFRSMLAIMREYPDFHFSQSQGSVYRIVEEFEPSMMVEIKQRIREGRWEVTATAWVETDKNMPSTESLARHILYTKQYMHEVWDVDPATQEIDFSPDTFGHSAHLPEINLQGNVKYYYHCRGNDVKSPLHRWRAPSGQEVLLYREPNWYNSGITPSIATGLLETLQHCAGLRTGLVVYGVGNHGGGPTRRDVERAMEMQQWPIFPSIKFGTLREFFKEAETVWDSLPVIATENNFIFPGCYTTQSRIKMGNRHSESALYKAEALSALAKQLVSSDYHTKPFEHAWRDVLFTHFHDILTGSCVQDSREHAMGLYSNALAVANTQYAQAMRAIAQKIDTSALAKEEDISSSQSEGAGAGYGISSFSAPSTEHGAGLRRIFHVFNHAMDAQTTQVEITVWDWTGDLRQIHCCDVHGKTILFQLLDMETAKYWDHKYFRILVEVTLPPMGYTTVTLDEKELEVYPTYYHPTERTEKPYTNMILENDHIRAEFSHLTGALLSLRSKLDHRELIDPKSPACLQIVQADGNSDSAWKIGRYMNVSPVDQNVAIQPLPGGDLCEGFVMEATALSSKIKATISLGKNDKALHMHLHIDWHEFSKDKGPVPTLVYAAKLAYPCAKYLYDVPAGSIYREGMHIDVPALSYAAAVHQGAPSLAIATDAKYGYRGVDQTLSTTLIHSACSPDPYPERGIHDIHMYLMVADACPKAMHDMAFALLHTPSYLSAKAQSGTLPMECALLSQQAGSTAIVSGIKMAQDDSGMIVRLYETCGKPTLVHLTCLGDITAVENVDIMEQPQHTTEQPQHTTGQPQHTTATFHGKTCSIALPAYALRAVKITL